MHLRRALLADGWRENLRLELDSGGLITGLGSGPPQPGDDRLEGPVIPGMPNLHSHAFQALIGGLTGRRAAGRDSFWTWRERMYDLAARVDPSQLQHCAAGVYMEMLRNGYTACAEFHYLHRAPDGRPYDHPAEMSERLLAAAGAAGIGLTLLPVLYRRSGFGADRVEGRQARFALGVDEYLRLVHHCRSRATGDPLLQVGVAPHSLRAVDRDDLLALQGEFVAGPVHIHVAEQPREVEDCLHHLGARPVEWLLDTLPLDEHWCLVHATHTTPEEVARAAAAGAVAGLCPSTEADLGDGFFDAETWVAEGGAWGVGSDSNLRLSPGEELRLLEFGLRLRSGRRNVLATEGESCGRFLFTAAAAGGGQALGQPIGQIAPGFRADLVELEVRHPWLQGLAGDELLDTLVFAGGPELIRSVYVAGALRVRDGEHLDAGSLLPPLAAVMRTLRA